MINVLDLITDIENTEGCSKTKKKIIDLVYKYGSIEMHLPRGLVFHRYKNFVKTLKACGKNKGEIIEGLQLRFGLSLRTAYRWYNRVAFGR